MRRNFVLATWRPPICYSTTPTVEAKLTRNACEEKAMDLDTTLSHKINDLEALTVGSSLGWGLVRDLILAS